MGETDGNRAPVTLGEIAANTRLLSALEKHDVIEVKEYMTSM